MPARSPDPAEHRRLSPRSIAAAVLAVALLVAGAFLAGRFSAPNSSTPADTGPEAGFARDMQTHHLQGVELALLVRDRSDDPDLRLLATDMITAQASQAGQLYGLLVEWGLDQAPSEPSMTWMTRPPADAPGGHGASHTTHEPGERMPGLATPEQVQALTDAEGVAAERLFYELMIEHHAGGVEMARALLERSDRESVRSIARGIVTTQESEMGLMRDLLAELPAA